MQRRNFLGILSGLPLAGLLKIKSSEDSDKYFKSEIIDRQLKPWESLYEGNIIACSGSICATTAWTDHIAISQSELAKTKLSGSDQ